MTDVLEDIDDANHRRDRRSRGFLAAKISWQGGLFTVDCIMRDVSPTGARLKLPPLTAVPSDFYLVEIRTGEIWETKVAWRRHPEIGVTFVRSRRGESETNADVRMLERLRVEGLERAGRSE